MLSKHGIVLRKPTPSYAYCTVGSEEFKDVNVNDIYERFADWKLTPEQFVAEIRQRIGR